MRYLLMPRLVERIQAAAAPAGASSTATGTTTSTTPVVNSSITSSYNHLNNNDNNQNINMDMGSGNNQVIMQQLPHQPNFQVNIPSSFTPENSSTAASSDSFGAQVSPVSDMADCYNYPVNHQSNNQDYYPANHLSYGDTLTSPTGYFNQGLRFPSYGAKQPMDGRWRRLGQLMERRGCLVLTAATQQQQHLRKIQYEIESQGLKIVERI